MLVKFFHHGVGEADSAVRYLTATRPFDYLAGAKDKKGAVRNPAPAVVRGNAELTRQLINQLTSKKHRYVSGVLSFRELISPQDEQRIMDRFEAAAFAGLEPGQFDCMWIRHAHNKRSELHFLVPRCELSTGKALNIRPPGKRSEDLFDTFRKLVNRDFHLKDPDRSVARLSDAEITALREKLGRLTAARAKYNRSRFPAPSLITPCLAEPHEDRNRVAGRNPRPPGARAHDPQQGHGRSTDRLDQAAGAMGAAALQCADAADRLGRAVGALRTRRDSALSLLGDEALRRRYGIAVGGEAPQNDRDGEELELIHEHP